MSLHKTMEEEKRFLYEIKRCVGNYEWLANILWKGGAEGVTNAYIKMDEMVVQGTYRMENTV